ncbi:putative signal transduction protein with Nacht domain [Thiorhodococcus drewsii AZ1]|uniref:Putative signal transduction protein with Nacht domain n=1 Tax=Thiorhodococcus drewsii AZ1 TaxID=765913 RepID=G2E4T2_9GAMM|nr:NACHT domain-containing protein [Thiorhodococcus drewsii]EGV29558.1 putative signal transduction protein with Nacht domain [Thiorhodococcus drewsii AZ1]
MSTLHTIAERNARVSARGEYARWLARRFGDLDLLLTKEGEDRVHLRDIYVPVRLDTEDRGDESIGDAEGLKEEQPPGRDARELIAELPLVAISGRPGSGKTTLVQAIVGELVSERSSEFRRRLVGQRGILPVPLILRDYQNELPSVQCLDDLLEHWWRQASREAADKGYRLDIQRLRQSYATDGDRLPLFLLFDGIDEVGGLEPRRHLLELALSAVEAGHRVVLTGRPTGFQDLPIGSMQWVEPEEDLMQAEASEPESMDPLVSSEPEEATNASPVAPSDEPAPRLDTLLRDIRNRTIRARDKLTLSDSVSVTVTRQLRLHHIQPFVWPQIRAFIERFFLIRDEWRAERERFLADFESALSDAQRGYLLTLARRPIFLTLMALVHANDRRMPHGRADLYRRIIDLYLVRQNQQRRLRWSCKGGEMPHWDEREVRRALGYLAWRSQHRGAKAKGANNERDRRQVVWTGSELLAELQILLSPENAAGGGFREIRPEDAEDLLGYFLHPTGLLVEPAEDRFQFAHLSFQEYLCAEYIHGRALALGSRRFLDGIQDLLYANLGLPGWDEVGLLLLCIHANQGPQTERTAHLELLTELDPAELPQARLLIAALTGQELDFDEAERLRWLPLAAATALVYPNERLAKGFSRVTPWSGPGLELLQGLFAATDPLEWLRVQSRAASPGGMSEHDWAAHSLNGKMLALWQQPPNVLSTLFGVAEGHAYALLLLANQSGWGAATPARGEDPAPMDTVLESVMTEWLEQLATEDSGLLYRRGVVDEIPSLPGVMASTLELQRLLLPTGSLWLAFLARVPLDAWILQGELLDRFSFLFGQVANVYGRYPRERPPAATRLALTLYQALRACEAMIDGSSSTEFVRSRLLALGLSLSPILELSLDRLQQLSQSLPASPSPVRSFPLSLSLNWSMSKPSPSHLSVSLSLEPTRNMAASLAKIEVLSQPMREFLANAAIRAESLAEGQTTTLAVALETFGYRFAALDWFEEQAEDPNLMLRRGLRPGEPLPRDLGLFDDTGRPLNPFPRTALLRLRDWLDDDDRILHWVFPDGLPEAEERDLREQLHILHHAEQPDGSRGQPWSPIAALDAVLADWPEDQPTREVSLAAVERDLMPVLEALFPDA